MENVITDVVYKDGKKERFSSKTPPTIVDNVLTNSSYSSITINRASGNLPDDTVFGVQMDEVRRFSYKISAD